MKEAVKRITVKIALLLTISMLFASPSHAEWTEVTKNKSGVVFYVDFERIREHSGYVYFWYLADYLKPSPYGDKSHTQYLKMDCSLFRYNILKYYFYKGPMGSGSHDVADGSAEWSYPPPKSAAEAISNKVCGKFK